MIRTLALINFMPLLNITAGTCQSLGLSPGCCNPTSVSSCYVPAGTCYCDPTCHINGDCCSDVTRSQCPARSQRVSLRGESVTPSVYKLLKEKRACNCHMLCVSQLQLYSKIQQTKFVTVTDDYYNSCCLDCTMHIVDYYYNRIVSGPQAPSFQILLEGWENLGTTQASSEC